MTNNKSVCTLIMGPDGELGIKGKGFFKNTDEVEKFEQACWMYDHRGDAATAVA